MLDVGRCQITDATSANCDDDHENVDSQSHSSETYYDDNTADVDGNWHFLVLETVGRKV